MSGSDVLVTAMGIVCAIGEDKDSFWLALSQAQCGIGTVDLFDVSGYRSGIGGQVQNVDFFSRLQTTQLSEMFRMVNPFRGEGFVQS